MMNETDLIQKKSECDETMFNEKEDYIAENQLIALAQQGDEEAIESLITQYRNLLNYIVSGYFLRDGDRDDLMQEAMIGFVQAIESYRPDSGKQFKNFAWLCVTRELDTCVKRSNRKKHMILSDALCLSADEPEDPMWMNNTFAFADRDGHGRFATPENTCISDESFQELFHVIYKALSGLELNVLLLRFAGLSYEDITHALQLESKSVDNAIQRIRKKLNRNHLSAILQAP